MKLRKLLSLTLAFLMVAALVPALLVPASAATADAPVSFPGLGGDYYIDALRNSEEWNTLKQSTSTQNYKTTDANGNHRQDWYTASGVTFEIRPTTEGNWAGSASSTADPYFCFNIILDMAQRVTVWKGSGAGSAGTATDTKTYKPASFWFNDYGQNQPAHSPKVNGDKATAYYSDDNGKTWKSVNQKDVLNHKYSAINLAGLSTEGVLIYIPLEEFWFTGFNNSTEGMGVDCYYGDFRPFREGVEWLKNNSKNDYILAGYNDENDRTSLADIMLTYRTANAFSKDSQWKDGKTAAQHGVAVVDASDIRLVYNVADETKIEKTGDTFAASFYTNQPATVTDQTVTATINGTNTTLTGVKNPDGRVKYTLSGLTAQDLGSKVTFTYTSEKTGTKTATVIVKDPTAEVLETKPSSLRIGTPNMSTSNIYRRSAVFAGDSLIAAVRDSAAGGWSGRIASSYTMNNKNIGIGGKCLSDWKENTGHNAIYTQITGQQIATQLDYNEQVDYVILDGGINDINRAGSVLGSVSPDGSFGYDVGTIMGGLEYAISQAKRVYPNATIGFIILFKMPLAKSSSMPDGLPCRDLEYTQKFVDAAKAVCEKWDVHYLNMFEDPAFSALIETDKATTPYMDQNDMLHLNAAGYELTAPYVAAWMETLPLSENAVPDVEDEVTPEGPTPEEPIPEEPRMPTALPDSGEGFYSELFRETPSTAPYNFNNESGNFNDWYKAEGVMFKLDAANAGRWHSNENAVANDVYFCFDLALYTRQKVYGYKSNGSQTNGYGVFWTNDEFYGEEQTGNLAGASSTAYYTEDGGKTWLTASTGTSTSRAGVGIYAMNLTNVNTENVWVYIPMSDFSYYGAYESGGHALGLNSYHKGFDTLENGIAALEEAKLGNVGSTAYGTTARNFLFTSSTPSTVTVDGSTLSNCATAGVTISNMQFVYDVIDTASVTVENDLAMSIYAAETQKAAGVVNVSATLGGETYELTGVTQADGRVKYTLDGILPQQIGDDIVFNWTNTATGLGQTITTSVKDYAEKLLAATNNDNLKTLLNTMLHYGAEAQKYANYKADTLCNVNAGAVTNVNIAGLTAPYSTPTAAFTNVALVLEDALMFQITLADGVTAVNYECGEFSGALNVVDGSVYFDVYAFRAADAIKLTANGETWTLSLNWYLMNVQAAEAQDLIQAIVNYTSAAAAYRAAK